MSYRNTIVLNNHNFKQLFTLFFFLPLLGCANKGDIQRKQVSLEPTPPEYFQLQVEVVNSKIIKHQLLDIYINDQIPDLRYSHRGLYQGHLVLVMRSDRFYQSQWVAKVPFRFVDESHQINGTFLVEAHRYNRTIAGNIERWTPPPSMVRWQVEFKSKRIVEQSILKPLVEWGKFYYSNKDISKKVVTFTNSNYHGCFWKGRYSPGDLVPDGKVIVNLKLVNHECFPYKD